MPAEPVLCLTCGQRMQLTRGCCTTCYRRHAKEVQAGRTTWAALVAAGRALPAQRPGKAWRRFPMRNGP
jgi:hypothetical protein